MIFSDVISDLFRMSLRLGGDSNFKLIKSVSLFMVEQILLTIRFFLAIRFWISALNLYRHQLDLYLSHGAHSRADRELGTPPPPFSYQFLIKNNKKIAAES